MLNLLSALAALRKQRFGSLAAAERATGICPSSWRSYEMGISTPYKRRRRRLEKLFAKPWDKLMVRTAIDAAPVSLLRSCRLQKYGPLRIAAQTLGISKSVLCEIERGRPPSARMRQKLEATFEIPFKSLSFMMVRK